MASRPLAAVLGKGASAQMPFDGFDTVLAQVVQEHVGVGGQQPHHAVGTVLGGSLDPKLGTACPGVGQPAFP